MHGWMTCNISALTSTCRGLSCSAKTKFTFTVTLKVACKGRFYKYLTRSNASPLTAPPLAFLKLSPKDLWPQPFSSLLWRTFHIRNGDKKNLKKNRNLPSPCQPWTQTCLRHQQKNLTKDNFLSITRYSTDIYFHWTFIEGTCIEHYSLLRAPFVVNFIVCDDLTCIFILMSPPYRSNLQQHITEIKSVRCDNHSHVCFCPTLSVFLVIFLLFVKSWCKVLFLEKITIRKSGTWVRYSAWVLHQTLQCEAFVFCLRVTQHSGCILTQLRGKSL